MKENLIVYRNKTEVKLLFGINTFIFIFLLFFIGISTGTEDVGRLFRNLGVVVAASLPFYLIIYIIYRFKIEFDFENKLLKYRGYFKRTKVYSFDKLEVLHEHGHSTLPGDYSYVFFFNNKKLFTISSLDWTGQTKADISYLNSLLTGVSKELFIMLSSINCDSFWINAYSPLELIAIIYTKKADIHFGYKSDRFYLLALEKNHVLEEHYKDTIEEITTIFYDLISKYNDDFKEIEE